MFAATDPSNSIRSGQPTTAPPGMRPSVQAEPGWPPPSPQPQCPSAAGRPSQRTATGSAGRFASHHDTSRWTQDDLAASGDVSKTNQREARSAASTDAHLWGLAARLAVSRTHPDPRIRYHGLANRSRPTWNVARASCPGVLCRSNGVVPSGYKHLRSRSFPTVNCHRPALTGSFACYYDRRAREGSCRACSRVRLWVCGTSGYPRAEAALSCLRPGVHASGPERRLLLYLCAVHAT